MAVFGRDEARKHIALGTDPSVKRNLNKITAATAAQNTYGAVTAEALASRRRSATPIKRAGAKREQPVGSPGVGPRSDAAASTLTTKGNLTGASDGRVLAL